MIHIYASTDRSVYNLWNRYLAIEWNGPGRSVYAPRLLFCIMIRIDWSVRPCNFGSIDPAWSNTLFIIFKNYNFKGIIVILKINSLMWHKVYEISLQGHSYHCLLYKNNFSLTKIKPIILFINYTFYIPTCSDNITYHLNMNSKF